MKPEYDFSKGERGRFFRPDADMRLAIYEPLLPTLPLLKEVPDSFYYQFVVVPITAASQFFVELSSQIRG